MDAFDIGLRALKRRWMRVLTYQFSHSECTRHVENLRSSHFWGFDVLNAKVDGRVVGRQLPVVPRGLKTGDQESSLLARRLIREEGLLCSGSCGSAVAAALKAAKDLKAGQRCVVIQRSTSARSSTCGMKS
ncbi:hypothetical protein PF010_g10476 [Phytophthora fragariae]|uniref:Tryptophan synthase beta chain-like PALP domain-containing protein n=1 Tax=Phytophthora fragariae TaxID=53985 RepID=A0A6G0L8H1_9STRA|nr:hypothetical protein PF010_g10476 [Phytophthora fragariae]